MITRTLTPITQSELAWMDQFHVLPTWVTGSRSREQYTTESPQQEPFLGAANTQSLEVMVQNLCVIQKKLLSENLTEHNTIELLLMVSDLQWKGGNSSSRLRQQQYAAQQFLQELGGWKIFYSHCQEQKTPPEHRYSSVPLFTKEEILQCQNVEARRFQVDFQGAQFLLGVFHAYSSFPRQKTLPSLTPASLFHELNKVELEAYFDLTAEMAKNLRSTSNIHINLSIPASVTSISPRRSNFFAQASRLSRKLKDHGAITYRDSESWLTHLDWSKTSPHWLTQSAGILGKVQKDYLNLCSKFFIYTFLKKHNPFIPLVRHRLAKSGELRLLQEGYIESIRLFLSNRYHSMLTFTLADQSVITGLELFWECVLAKKLCLPIPIGLQEIAAPLKALEWDSAQTITKFCNTFWENLAQHTTFISICSKQEFDLPIREIKTRTIHEIRSTTEPPPPPHSKTDSKTPPKQKEKAPVMHTSLANLQFDIAKVRQNNLDLYSECLSAYLTSLETQSRDLITQIRARMPEAEFLKHLEPRLTKFVTENPTWSQKMMPQTQL